ncbi:MAG: sulfotransferase domain-containing protein [Actinomycetes bacterium]
MRSIAEGRRGGDLPTFIVIGAMKAGTTSLYHYLRHHDEVFMPKVKELDFFVEEMNWSRGVDWYAQQFAGADAKAVARGEASTVYAKFPRYRGVPARMAAVVPDVRLVYVVRDPIERIRSHYRHRVAMGAETAGPDVALFENPIYLDYSRYALQVEQYLDHFPPGQLMVITSEALRSERAPTMRTVYAFLGVDPDFVAPVIGTEFYRTDQRRSYPPVVWSARQLVKRRFPQAKRAKELVDSVASKRRRAAAEPLGAAAGAGGSAPAGPDDDSFPSPLRERLAELLVDDVARLRSHVGHGFDGWGIA